MKNHKFLSGGLFCSAVWCGMLWYPYRVLEKAGVSGETANLLNSLFALILLTLLFPKAWRDFRKNVITFTVFALACGLGSIAYVFSILNGEVIRILLLHNLLPLWAIPLSYLILNEKISRAGYIVVLLSICGAVTMLWNPSAGIPTPSNSTEWMALAAGFCYALASVTARRIDNCNFASKALFGTFGIAVASSLVFVLKSAAIGNLSNACESAALIVLLGMSNIAIAIAEILALSKMSAVRVNTILLLELVVAAISSYLLADESMQFKEWIGGAIILLAGFANAHIDECQDAVCEEQPPEFALTTSGN
jgi:drug/metabolite transporter (DMT)-like permease